MPQAKALTAIIIITVLSILFLGMGGYIYYQDSKVTTLTEANTTLKGKVEKFEKAVKLDTKSDKITDTQVGKRTVEAREIEKTAEKVNARSKARENGIDKKYEQLIAAAQARANAQPPVAVYVPTEIEVLQHERTEELSASRIDSLWESYCSITTSPECPVPTTPST